jgi:hypothetical protein
MTKSISYLFIVPLLIFSINIQAQGSKEKALSYFSDYKSKNKMNELILNSFPTLVEAEKIFIKKEDALQFMKLINALEKKMREEAVGKDEDFLNVDINTFTIKDIKESKTNYNLGLLQILDKFKPTVRFFTVKLMRENLFENGFSYIYWVSIGDKWLYIAKPQQAFNHK